MSNRPSKPFPWDDVMQFGFGVLKLSSRDFWAMTPREMAFAMRAFAPSSNTPLSRSSFDELLTNFPDKGIK